MSEREPLVERESLRDSVRHLSTDLSDLFRAELALFKREAMEELRRVLSASVWLGAGAIMGLVALGAFTAFAIIVLTLVFPAWIAALVITIAWGVAAVSLLAAGIIQLRSGLPVQFEETARSVKEDIEWIKSGAKSAR
jgi:hypothetical protein